MQQVVLGRGFLVPAVELVQGERLHRDRAGQEAPVDILQPEHKVAQLRRQVSGLVVQGRRTLESGVRVQDGGTQVLTDALLAPEHRPELPALLPDRVEDGGGPVFAEPQVLELGAQLAETNGVGHVPVPVVEVVLELSRLEHVAVVVGDFCNARTHVHALDAHGLLPRLEDAVARRKVVDAGHAVGVFLRDVVESQEEQSRALEPKREVLEDERRVVVASLQVLDQMGPLASGHCSR